MIEVLVISIIIIIAIVAIFLFYNNNKAKKVEIDPQNIKDLATYVRAQKEEAEKQQQLRELKRADQKQKLENFKQTKEQLKDKLRAQINSKEWQALERILNTKDKGGIGIYILYNATKNKYYVGQAKQIYKRIRDHFCVEEIARDFLRGDNIHVKFLTANELDADYRIDHIERTGIEIFDAEKNGYNRREGNL